VRAVSAPQQSAPSAVRPAASIAPAKPFDFKSLKPESKYPAPTPGGSGGVWGVDFSPVVNGIKATAAPVGRVGAAAFGGCVSSAAAFSGGVVAATGGAVAATGEGFLMAVGGSCAFGAAGGIGSYFIGHDAPESMVDDFRQGLEFGLHR
jgi:hypothetical protein